MLLLEFDLKIRNLELIILYYRTNRINSISIEYQ